MNTQQNPILWRLRGKWGWIGGSSIVSNVRPSVCSTMLNVAVILRLGASIVYFSTFCGKICDHLFITKDQMATKPAAAVASYIDFWGKKYGCALSSSLQLSRFFQLDKKPMRHHLCCSNFILESIWKRVGRIVQCSSRVKRSWIFKI